MLSFSDILPLIFAAYLTIMGVRRIFSRGRQQWWNSILPTSN